MSAKPRIVYVVGSGRSGSTILDMMLGAHSRALSLGQVDELDRWARGGQYCTCGRSLADCPLWGRALEGREPPASLNAPGRARKALSLLAAISRRRPPESPPHQIDETWTLYERVAELSGAEVLIDSSKSLLRFARLAAEPRDHELRLIHLVRDARGFVLSRTRSKPVPTASGEVGKTRSQSLPSAIADWVVQNALIDAYTRRRRPRHLVVTYEDLVGDPTATLARLARFVGTDFEPDRQLPPLSGEFHLIGGNASRLGFGGLRADERWRTELPRWRRLVTRASTGWLDTLLRARASDDRRRSRGADRR